jgi:hypothetical protein
MKTFTKIMKFTCIGLCLVSVMIAIFGNMSWWNSALGWLFAAYLVWREK